MRNMSFFLTTEQFMAGTKTVTRRLGWRDLKPGDIIQGVEKAQGLRKGERINRLRRIRIVDVRQEPLRRMTDDRDYGHRETTLEGFPPGHPKHDPAAFVDMFCQSHRGCVPETVVTRIEYSYLD